MIYRALRSGFVSLIFLSLIAACGAPHTSVVSPTDPGRERETRELPPEQGGGGDGGPAATPTPQPTPDAAAEDFCNNNGGVFVDLVGGGGVQCIEPGAPLYISGGVPNCGVKWGLTTYADGSRHGFFNWDSGSFFEFDKGGVLNVTTCEWTTYSNT